MGGQHNRIRRPKNSRKKRWRCSGTLRSYTMERLLRRSVTESGLRRLRKQLNARLEESVINKLETLQNCKIALKRPAKGFSSFYGKDNKEMSYCGFSTWWRCCRASCPASHPHHPQRANSNSI